MGSGRYTSAMPGILAHLTDIHLDCVLRDLPAAARRALEGVPPDAKVLITGDIGTASTFSSMLLDFVAGCERDVFFVLGNHDAWGGSIASSRRAAAVLGRKHPGLVYLPAAGVVPLSETSALVGIDGWYDGRVGDVHGSTMRLNDWVQVEELRGLHRQRRLEVLEQMAVRSAARATEVLSEALSRFAHVYLATHVPPFPSASVNEKGEPSSPASLPYYCNFTLGMGLSRLAADHPEKRITVLAGHCHGAADVMVADNLRSITGRAQYGTPSLAGLHPFE